jgi:hypothetical protein
MIEDGTGPVPAMAMDDTDLVSAMRIQRGMEENLQENLMHANSIRGRFI